jgi:signal transduction histidine kinase
MSHELRNLLGAVQGYSEMLAEDGVEDAVSRAEIAERVRALSTQALDVINTTLELSRSLHDNLALNVERITLRPLFERLNTEIANRGVSSPVELKWEAPDIELETDRIKLEMILRNLVGNAMKFTSAGSVRVCARPSADVVVIEVIDTGSGIAPKDVLSIFEPFEQAAAGRRTSGGAGLGLYVVKRLVSALGGRIEVDSRLGVGSTFRVTLPPSMLKEQ